MGVLGIDIPESQIRIIPAGLSKQETLETLIDAVCTNPMIPDAELFKRAVFEREGVSSTGIGGGIAIPHVRLEGLPSPTLGIAVAHEGVDFDTLDNDPVYVLVLFATPKDADKTYLSLLAQVMIALRDIDLFEKLSACRTVKEVHALVKG
jgi:mannitol/fructose-specific phosphotransferase system IIA component (Ntr-type)